MLVGSTVRRVAVVGGVRIPFARSMGAYAHASNQQMLTATLRALVERYDLRGQRLGDVGAGAVLKHSQDFNLTREAVFDSGLAPETPAFDLQRACGTSLDTAILIGLKIATGQIDSGVAAGVDTASDVPIVYPKSYQQLLLRSARGKSLGARIAPWFGLRPRHFKPQLPAVIEPRTGLSMGQSCEQMAKDWGIARADQDQLALESHRKAAAAWDEGFYDDLVVDFAGLKQDDNIRRDTTLEKLAALKPAFAANGVLTAGNSTPMTDGASCVLLAS
ncbi:MAG TPA: acetyl-CoA C-acyltransferase, partial [Steroidobacter sp.]|nr:acetyl-CoA C-acyltransferase [Steroidobacter sp.]